MLSALVVLVNGLRKCEQTITNPHHVPESLNMGSIMGADFGFCCLKRLLELLSFRFFVLRLAAAPPFPRLYPRNQLGTAMER